MLYLYTQYCEYCRGIRFYRVLSKAFSIRISLATFTYGRYVHIFDRIFLFLLWSFSRVGAFLRVTRLCMSPSWLNAAGRSVGRLTSRKIRSSEEKRRSRKATKRLISRVISISTLNDQSVGDNSMNNVSFSASTNLDSIGKLQLFKKIEGGEGKLFLVRSSENCRGPFYRAEERM